MATTDWRGHKGDYGLEDENFLRELTVDPFVKGYEHGAYLHPVTIIVGRGGKKQAEVGLSRRAAVVGERVLAAQLRRPEAGTSQVRVVFEQQRVRWSAETGHLPSAMARFMHPAYQRIIGLGPAVVPLLLEELRVRPDHWFWALSAVTGEDPAAGCVRLDEAVGKWLEWGSRNGHL